MGACARNHRSVCSLISSQSRLGPRQSSEHCRERATPDEHWVSGRRGIATITGDFSTARLVTRAIAVRGIDPEYKYCVRGQVRTVKTIMLTRHLLPRHRMSR